MLPHVFVFLLLTAACQSYAASQSSDKAAAQTESAAVERINGKQWFDQTVECGEDDSLTLDSFRYNDSSFILRQSKCAHFEAPFMYLLLGEDKALLLDTGAIADASESDLLGTVQGLMTEYYGASTKPELLVMHSHSHSDHTAGDEQFLNQPGVTVVEPSQEAVQGLFPAEKWPEGELEIDLGGRIVTVIPAPGHHAESLALYDDQTQWLLVGDTIYPGNVMIGDWAAYRKTIARLSALVEAKPVSAVLGGHVETLLASPEDETQREAGIALTPDELLSLNAHLVEAGGEPGDFASELYTLTPMSPIQKFISGTLKWMLGK